MAIFTGTPNHDTFTGTAGDDSFVGIAGGDTVDGGGGDDTISIDLGYTDVAVSYDAVAAATAAGTSPLWYMSVKNVEHLGTLVTGGGDDNLTISAAQGAFTWNAGAGDDTLKLNYAAATAGITTAQTVDGFTARVNTWTAGVVANAIGVEHVQVTGSALDDDIVGLAGNDILLGGAGNDIIDTRGGKDYVDGGAGYDTVELNTYWNAGTTNVVYDAGQAATATGFTLYDGTVVKNVEGLGGLVTGEGDDVLYVTAQQKGFSWIANGGYDRLVADYRDAAGPITVIAIASTPVGPDIRITSPGTPSGPTGDAYSIESLRIIGSAFADNIHGTTGNDSLNGGRGADILIGGVGDDTYYVDNVGDSVQELAGAGTDSVFASISYTLTNNVENLTLTGTANLAGTGNALNNTITGNDGNNVLDGKAGSDILIGGKGDDTYHVSNSGDVVVENANQGTDTVLSLLAAYTLGANVENLILGGVAVTGDGNALNNTITGNDGDNVLDGKAGADTLAGGLGNDTYYVDSFTDVITEAAGAGTDMVYSSADIYALAANIENLTLLGTGDTRATGNALDNVLTGNAGKNELNGGDGNDVLDGKAGADVMNGGLGNDTFYVDNAGDVIGEYSNQGTDTVIASVTYSLAGINAENLTLTGTAALNATGNGLVNVLTGNAGNNVLDGGAGADSMAGGDGNDTYYVDNAGDYVFEDYGQGQDIVMASVSYALINNNYVEGITLTGTANLNATGNNMANILVGNSGNNVLTGAAGDDTLTGGHGADRFVFTYDSRGVASGEDTITDFSAAEGDKIDLSGYHALGHPVITQHGADVLIDFGNTNGVFIHVLNTQATDPNFLSHIIW